MLQKLSLVILVASLVGCASGPKRDPNAPGTVVVIRLQTALISKDYNSASKAFDAESFLVRQRGLSPRDPEFYKIEAPFGDMLDWPIGPDDDIGEETILPDGSRRVAIERYDRRDLDPRPRAVLLERLDREWLITDVENY